MLTQNYDEVVRLELFTNIMKHAHQNNGVNKLTKKHETTFTTNASLLLLSSKTLVWMENKKKPEQIQLSD